MSDVRSSTLRHLIVRKEFRQLSDFSESIRLIYRLVKLGLFSLAYFDMLEYHIGNDYLVTAPKAK